ncbi:Uncharacterised protein [uncultured archaeon]|nr:Uncharacterised protein [uncultured archaeon]
MLLRLKKFWWKFQAGRAFDRLNVSPAARKSSKAVFIEQFMRRKMVGKNPSNALHNDPYVSPEPPKPAYVHEKIPGQEGQNNGTGIERKPGELNMSRVSKSARTEARLRAESRKNLAKGSGGGQPKA